MTAHLCPNRDHFSSRSHRRLIRCFFLPFLRFDFCFFLTFFRFDFCFFLPFFRFSLCFLLPFFRFGFSFFLPFFRFYFCFSFRFFFAFSFRFLLFRSNIFKLPAKLKHLHFLSYLARCFFLYFIFIFYQTNLSIYLICPKDHSFPFLPTLRSFSLFLTVPTSSQSFKFSSYLLILFIPLLTLLPLSPPLPSSPPPSPLSMKLGEELGEKL